MPQNELLWKGKGRLKGINAFFDYLEQKSYKIQFRVMLARVPRENGLYDLFGWATSRGGILRTNWEEETSLN